MTRLLQIATDPVLAGFTGSTDSGKQSALDRLVAELMAAPDQKVIIWSNYVQSLRQLVKRYAEHGAVAIYGEVPVGERQGAAAAFQTDPECRILVANPAAAGTGFTLTAATVAIYHSLTWRYDFFAQSQDRNHRIGQDQEVRYLRLVAADTIDEAVIQALARKKDMAAAILGDGEDGASLVSMSVSAFCEMIESNHLPE